MAEERVLAGRYSLESVLGQGGMAEVYLGTDQVLGRQIAVKVLGSQFSRDSSFVARFRREAQSAASLNHPNVVSVFDTGSDDGTHFIVMEYVQGKTLSQLIRQGPLLPERAAEIAAAVARALGFAHSQGIVHRDVKPGNVMLTPSADVKVMDFGIARATASESLTQTATVLGTATYFSPEQAQGEAVDPRSDVYSLGVVLYEMLTGHPPFAGESAVSIAYKHVREQPVPPSRLNPDVPGELDAIVLKCLAKNPANRYQTAEELLADLDRFLAGMPVQATPLMMEPTEVVERATRPTSVLPAAATEETEAGRRWVAWAIIGGILLIFAVALFFLARSVLFPGDLVTVPNVIGKPLPAAQLQLTQAGFEVGEVTREPSPEPVDQVLDYDPKEAELGAAIDLVVSSGPETVKVPDVVCKSRAQAVAQLQDAGFKTRRGPDEENPDCDPGTVARTDPEPKAEAAPGTTVVIFLVPAEVEPPSAPDLAAGSDSGSSSSDDVTNQTSLSFSGTAQPNVTVTLFRDGAQVATSSTDGSGNWSISDPAAPQGTHTYTARATDDEGNNSEMSPGLDVTVDTAAPNTTITSGPEGDVSDTSATFEFESTEAGSSFECQLDGGGFEPCTSPKTYEDLALGPHTFDVRATDAAGNTDASPASRTWTIV
jgi:beta-lactam-binding protein with PASTA domain/predicted Ser/Thr protein kinase